MLSTNDIPTAATGDADDFELVTAVPVVRVDDGEADVLLGATVFT